MDLLAVAAVRSAHGTAGELRVRSFSGETAHLLALRGVLLRRGSRERAAEVVAARPAPPDVLLTIAGIDNRERAQELVGWELWVDRSAAAPLGAGEYYAADLCRCGVYRGGERIGSVAAVCDAGAITMLEVRTRDGRIRMVPFTDHFVGAVDVAGGRIALRGDELLA